MQLETFYAEELKWLIAPIRMKFQDYNIQLSEVHANLAAFLSSPALHAGKSSSSPAVHNDPAQNVKSAWHIAPLPPPPVTPARYPPLDPAMPAFRTYPF
jgi:hypothetical protein